MSRAMRVAIVSVNNTYRLSAGNSAYLHSVADALAGAGCEVGLFLTDAFYDVTVKTPLGPRFAAPYALVAARGGRRVGDRLVATAPGNWARRAAMRLRARLGLTPPHARAALWELTPPSDAGVAWARRAVAAFRPDATLANYFNALAATPQVPGAPRAVLLHDVIALRAEVADAAGRPYDFVPDLLAREAAALGTADVAFAIQDEEAAYVRRRWPALRALTAPFAIEAPARRREDAGPICMFVGSDNTPNIEGLRWLLAEVWPRVRALAPQARLRVVGKVGVAVGAVAWPDGAECVGFAPDLDAELARARVTLAPLLTGSGLKIKTVEALARGVPCVATPVGAAGMPPAPEAALRVANGADAFAAAMAAALLADPAETEAAARAYAAAHYSPRMLAEALLTGLRPA